MRPTKKVSTKAASQKIKKHSDLLIANRRILFDREACASVVFVLKQLNTDSQSVPRHLLVSGNVLLHEI